MRLIDTSIAVDHLRGTPAAVELVSHLVESDEGLLASELVRFELLSGAREGELARLDDFFSALSWVPVDAGIAYVAGRLARGYRRSHSGIDGVDYLIAATAVVLGAELLTMNVRHFPMLDGLRAPY